MTTRLLMGSVSLVLLTGLASVMFFSCATRTDRTARPAAILLEEASPAAKPDSSSQRQNRAAVRTEAEDRREAAPIAPAEPQPPAAKSVERASGKLSAGPERRPRKVPAAPEADGLAPAQSPSFSGREDARFNRMTRATDDALSTFAVDVDTAAYSIARRSLLASQRPTESLVRVEEFVNYFKYGYEAPTSQDALFSIEATGTRSPVDANTHLLRIGIQARKVSDDERKPVNIVFLVDTSGSMSSPDKLRLAQRALAVAVDRLDERDQVAITTYAGGVRLVLPPTSGARKEEIKRALESLTSGGGTAMNSGMQLAYAQARAMMSSGEVTRVIVCSDGDANIGAASPRAILESIGRYVKEGIRMTTVGFGTGNYKDYMMEQLANRGNGNYFYIDSMRQAERVFGRDLFKMLQDVAQDVKIQVAFDADKVRAYRLVGYENRDVADADFRNDAVDAGEIGAGHQVTALYELVLAENATGELAQVRVRAKRPGGTEAKETSFGLQRAHLDQPFASADADYRFAVATMGAAELLRGSPYAEGWTFRRVLSLAADALERDPDRAEFVRLIRKASDLYGDSIARR